MKQVEKRNKEVAAGNCHTEKIYFNEEDYSIEDCLSVNKQKESTSIGRNLLEGGRCLLQVIFVLLCIAIFVWLFIL